MNFPVFSRLAGNFGFPETGSLETAASSGEFTNHRFLSGCLGAKACGLRSRTEPAPNTVLDTEVNTRYRFWAAAPMERTSI